MSTLDVAEVYRDDQGLFRFRVKASNHEIIAQGEAYERKQDAIDTLELHFPAAAIHLVDLTEES